MSKFINENGTLIFLGAETRTSKAGNPYTLVTIADTEKYQQHQFFKGDTAHINGLEQNVPVKIVLTLTTVGFNQRLELSHIEAI